MYTNLINEGCHVLQVSKVLFHDHSSAQMFIIYNTYGPMYYAVSRCILLKLLYP